MSQQNVRVKSAGTREEQLAELIRKLEGHKSFQKVRGKFDLTLLGLYLDIADESKSPSAFRKKWDDLMKSIVIMVQMLSTLDRDGKEDARTELQWALEDSTYVIRGQRIPPKELMPATLVMFRTKTTMRILRWVLFNSLGKIEPITKARGNEIFKKYFRDYLSKTLIPEDAIPLGIHRDHHNDMFNSQAEEMGRSSNAYYTTPFFFLFMGKNKDEVLSKISEKEHSSLTLWEMNTLEWYGQLGHHELGLYEESVSAHIRSLCPSMVSKDIAEGLGVAFVPHNGSSDIREAFTGYTRLPFDEGNPVRLLLQESEGGADQWREIF